MGSIKPSIATGEVYLCWCLEGAAAQYPFAFSSDKNTVCLQTRPSLLPAASHAFVITCCTIVPVAIKL